MPPRALQGILLSLPLPGSPCIAEERPVSCPPLATTAPPATPKADHVAETRPQSAAPKADLVAEMPHPDKR